MKLHSALSILALGSFALLTAFAAPQEDGAATQAREAAATKPVDDDAAQVKKQLPSYPLETCVVSGEKLGSMGDPIDKIHDGKLVRLCCKGCIKSFENDPKTFVDRIDAAVIAAQAPGYPVSECVVSHEPIEKPIDMVYGTRLVRLCCKGCKRTFNKNPDKFMAQIDEALIAKQKATYPLTTCLVSGEALEDPVDFLWGTQLVRVCCEGCKKPFLKDPAKHLAKLTASTK